MARTNLSLTHLAARAVLLAVAATHAASTSSSSPSDYTSTLLERGTVISFDQATESLQVLFNASVLVTDDRIAAIWTEEDGPENNTTVPPGTERISAEGKIISPGFVDVHRHGWQTAYKTLGADTTLAEYFDRYGEFTQASTVFTAEDIYLGQVCRLPPSSENLLANTKY